MSADLELRLRELLAFARAAVPWWAAQIPALLEAPFDVLRSLTPLTRRDVQRERARLTASSGGTSSWRRVRSSGTTGEPVDVILDEHALAAEGAAFANHLDRLLPHEWRRRPVVHLALHPEATSGAWQAPWGGLSMKWNLTRVWEAGEEARTRSMAYLDGAILTGLPSVISMIAAADVPRARPLAVVLSGENVGNAAAIAEHFSCPVTSQYVLAETGVAGVACAAAGGYHVATENVIVEIEDGEILITPLANRAMVLLRYRTGDAGEWLTEPCMCGDDRPRFSVTSRRVPDTTPMRLAKFFGALGITYRVAPGTIHYRPPRPLDDWQRAQVRREVARVISTDVVLQEENAGREVVSPAEWSTSRADWLNARPDVLCAVIGGSAADPPARHRDSDLDLIVFLRDRNTIGEWMWISGSLWREVPRLSVHVDVAEDLTTYAPLLAARLLDAHVHVAGAPLEKILRFPTEAELRAAAHYFSHDAAARVWDRITTIEPRLYDPIAESILISRIAIDALRYRHLLRGGRETRVDPLLASLANLPSELLSDVRTIVDIAREHRPPILLTHEVLRTWLITAWMCLETAVS
jgi:phenylacetate-coenzyme A ligase PaaK-like adenylate-forming protein